ncbi:MAG: hypothetical protein Q9174_004152 [Haloplaca sp. 1 TL-2023]
MKQLDLKAIDWNAVADELEITNGHAARMRYSRFKQQMEGYVPQQRKPREQKRKEKAEAAAAKAAKKQKKNDQSEVSNTSNEASASTSGSGSAAGNSKIEDSVKRESLGMSGLSIKKEEGVKAEPAVKEESKDIEMVDLPLAESSAQLPTTSSTGIERLPDEEPAASQDAHPGVPEAHPTLTEETLPPLPDFFSSQEEILAQQAFEAEMLRSEQIKTEQRPHIKNET